MSENYVKIVATRGIFEVKTYEKLNTKKDAEIDRNGSGSEHDNNYKRRMQMRKDAVRRLITSNFDSGSKFVTLTFNNQHDFDLADVQACNAYFKKFVMRLRYRYADFKYVAVIEFQDANGRGAVHYHMICNLPYIKKSELAAIWNGGFVKINRIDHVDNVGAYVVKYMTVCLDDSRLCGQNAYLHSKGLTEPVEVCSWRDSDSTALLEILSLLSAYTPVYERSYVSEHAGKVCYTQYNLNRIT